MTKAELKTLAAKLNTVRQDLLQQVRECKVLPPPLATKETGHSVSKDDGPNDFETFINDLFDKQLKTS